MKSRNHRVTLANLVAIVGYAVASTAGVPAEQQGLATRLVTMSQQVGIALRTLGGCGIIARANTERPQGEEGSTIGPPGGSGRVWRCWCYPC